MRDCIALTVTEASQIGEARRTAVALANELEFSETDRGKVAIIVTEAANNLLKHAKNGELLLRALRDEGGDSIELIALDRGPGMSNIAQCLGDGFSTAGSPGTGLGAIQRLSDRFDIHSTPAVGTALVARLYSGNGVGELSSKHYQSQPLEVGAINLAKAGEAISGDLWAVEESSDRTLILLSDGLGSGPLAAAASQEAVRILRANAQLSPKAILEKAHLALRSTRGAAVAIAQIDPSEQTVRYAGVGNISGVIVTDADRRSLVSYNGTVGHQVRKIEEFIYPWSPRSLLIMHSDGLGTQWSLERYPGLMTRHPTTIASVLYRDFKRPRDDVTVLVARGER